MVDIQSKEVIDKVSEDLKIQPAMKIPRELMEKIQLVYNVNPERLIQIRSATVSDGASTTIHTTNANKDTFLIAMNLSVAKSALSTSLLSTIQFTAFGHPARDGLVIRYEPLTAGQFTEVLELPHPIKLTRNTPVVVTNSTAIASIDTSGVIYFYEVDPQ